MSLAVPGARACRRILSFSTLRGKRASTGIGNEVPRRRTQPERQTPHVEAAENAVTLYRKSEAAMYFVVPRNPRQLLSFLLDSQRATTGGGCSLQHLQ